MMEVSCKNKDGAHCQQCQNDQGEKDILPACLLLYLVGLIDILPCQIDVAVGREEFLANGIQLFSLLVDQDAGLLNYIMDIHDALADDVDFMVALVHQFAFHFELHLHLLLVSLTVRRCCSGLAVFVRESAPSRKMAAGGLLQRCLVGMEGVGGSRQRSGSRWGVLVIGRLQQLVPAVPLDAKLLLGRADLASCVWVEVGLLQFLDECVYIVGSGLDDGLFLDQSGCDEGMRFYTDGSVQVIVAVLEFLYQGDGLVIGRIELPSHFIRIKWDYLQRPNDMSQSQRGRKIQLKIFILQLNQTLYRIIIYNPFLCLQEKINGINILTFVVEVAILQIQYVILSQVQ